MKVLSKLVPVAAALGAVMLAMSMTKNISNVWGFGKGKCEASRDIGESDEEEEENIASSDRKSVMVREAMIDILSTSQMDSKSKVYAALQRTLLLPSLHDFSAAKSGLRFFAEHTTNIYANSLDIHRRVFSQFTVCSASVHDAQQLVEELTSRKRGFSCTHDKAPAPGRAVDDCSVSIYGVQNEGARTFAQDTFCTRVTSLQARRDGKRACYLRSKSSPCILGRHIRQKVVLETGQEDRSKKLAWLDLITDPSSKTNAFDESHAFYDHSFASFPSCGTFHESESIYDELMDKADRFYI